MTEQVTFDEAADCWNILADEWNTWWSLSVDEQEDWIEHLNKFFEEDK